MAAVRSTPSNDTVGDAESSFHCLQECKGTSFWMFLEGLDSVFNIGIIGFAMMICYYIVCSLEDIILEVLHVDVWKTFAETMILLELEDSPVRTFHDPRRVSLV